MWFQGLAPGAETKENPKKNTMPNFKIVFQSNQQILYMYVDSISSSINLSSERRLLISKALVLHTNYPKASFLFKKKKAHEHSIKVKHY